MVCLRNVCEDTLHIGENDDDDDKLTMYKMHHPKADIDSLYVKRKEGGRGWYKLKQHIKQR
jgi:hypothetical protein